jgi:cytochrome c oxidase assembly protein subunit 15
MTDARATAERPRLGARLWAWLPDRVDRRVVAAAWATLVVQIGIVGTGGLVRLTASGLGCPTWPECTAGSFVPTPESLAIGLYVPLQAIIGGITVLTNLNPYVVGLHYFASVVLVALSTVLVYRVYTGPGPRALAVPRWYAAATHLTSAAVLVTVLVGILVTGAGPHAGDAGAARNGLDPELMQHLHAWPGYVTFALTVVLLIGSLRIAPALRLWVGLLLAVELVQIAVGLWQARSGLPIVLVNIHMVLAVVLVAAMTAVVLHLKTPVKGVEAAADGRSALAREPVGSDPRTANT